MGPLLLAALEIPVRDSQRSCDCAKRSLAVSGFPTDQRNGDKEFVIRRAATNRVLNVLRHWVSKHSQVGGGGPGGVGAAGALSPRQRDFGCERGGAARLPLEGRVGTSLLIKRMGGDGEEMRAVGQGSWQPPVRRGGRRGRRVCVFGVRREGAGICGHPPAGLGGSGGGGFQSRLGVSGWGLG